MQRNSVSPTIIADVVRVMIDANSPIPLTSLSEGVRLTGDLEKIADDHCVWKDCNDVELFHFTDTVFS